jgi:fused signal recognition particle receptor
MFANYDLANLAPGGKIDEDVLEELESLLVMADVGVETAERIVGQLQKSLARKQLKDIDALRAALRAAILEILEPVAVPLEIPNSRTGRTFRHPDGRR